MSKIYNLVNELHNKGSYYARYGYGTPSLAEMQLFMYDLSELNKETLSFTGGNLPLKMISSEVSTTENGKSVKWYDDDMRIPSYEIDTVNSATELVITGSAEEGEELYNETTGKTYVVTGSATNGTVITIQGAGDADAAVGNRITPLRYGKKFGEDDGLAVKRNDYTPYENFIYFGEYKQRFTAHDVNQNHVFLKDPKEFVKSKVSNLVRKAIDARMISFYFGLKHEITGASDRYYAGGLDHFIPASHKVNIWGSTDPVIRQNIENQMVVAGQSGLNTSNMMLAVNSKMRSLMNRIWDPKLIINDKLNAINIDISTYDMSGYQLKTFHSNVLERAHSSTPLAFLIPMDHAMTFNIPNASVDDKGNTTKNFDFLLYKKPEVTPEAADLALYTSHSNMFLGVTSGAYQRWSFVKNS